MNASQTDSLRRNVNTLGRMLGDVIKSAEGDDFLHLIEEIRGFAKQSRSGSEEDFKRLQSTLKNLSNEQLVPVARAFSQFLNLANIADQHHGIARGLELNESSNCTLRNTISELRSENYSSEELERVIEGLNIELVLTAHPTEISRRSHVHKYSEIDACLGQLELNGLTDREHNAIYDRLRNLITQIWYSHDFRENRPTPVDEARWGFTVVENSLWDAVPDFCRQLDEIKRSVSDQGLALDAVPVSFASWIGSDRDGNPNVTAQVTSRVLLLSRWKAADLFYGAVNRLVEELSMTACNGHLRSLTGECREPYREILRNLRNTISNTLKYLEAKLDGERGVGPHDILRSDRDLISPLIACYQSLIDCGMGVVANQELLDTIRRAYCFGIHLVKHDIRQESGRHTQVLSELTQELGIGDYAEWNEDERRAFLLRELSSKRPLFPRNWQPSADAQEVLDTCRIAAQQSREALACYIISMAQQASDVLAVRLLLQESGCDYELPVAPLFETLDDLQRAPNVISDLLNIDGFKDAAQHRLMVMIGYSDSAKDAGVLAASWAQYCAQEALVELCEQQSVELLLFHGRGGTIGRGGAPAHAALLSQPPGSLRSGLRVTEQGEMIRTKLGVSGIAVQTLLVYASAIIRANLDSPPSPPAEWRELMQEMADDSCNRYREFVRGNARFVEYFRQATPEQELAKLPLGSRPARRKTDGGIASLRAIPWIFAWSQNRLMLPAWLGAGNALARQLKLGRADKLAEMAHKWPFFATRVSMLEMVFAKADISLSEYYDKQLVEPELRSLGETLRSELLRDIKTILSIVGEDHLLANQDWARRSIELRNIYTDPLNLLQAELLARSRHFTNQPIEQAIMVTIAGVAAGMRNTG